MSGDSGTPFAAPRLSGATFGVTAGGGDRFEQIALQYVDRDVGPIAVHVFALRRYERLFQVCWRDMNLLRDGHLDLALVL
jgi:hypothetical protein